VSRFVSEALGKQERAGFTSGNDRIDTYFRNVVTHDIKRKYAVCYVLTDKQSGQIAGFYTLSAHTIALTDVPADIARKLPRYPSVPAVLIGWMGRDINFRGQQIGTLLLADAIHRLVYSPVGAHAICADAIDGAAAAFYREHQFLPLVSRPMRLFLPMNTASSLIAAG
jgi:ribosomal protein S18 acetylase RimI-like enzyme